MDATEYEPLVMLARRGDKEALARLCIAFYPKVLRYLYYRADAASAEDLAAEVFLKVIRGIGEQRGSFQGWLYRIAANVVIDEHRKRTARREQPMDERVTESTPAGRDPAANVARREDLRQAVTQLTADQRELVTLKFIQGLSNQEVSEITGRKINAIRALQFRALSALRHILGSKDEDHA